MAIIAVAGRKGGIGKSTIVGNLASEFAAMGYSVVALDADPQHSLAAWAAQGEGMLAGCVEKVNAAGAETLRARAREADEEADIVPIGSGEALRCRMSLSGTAGDGHVPACRYTVVLTSVSTLVYQGL